MFKPLSASSAAELAERERAGSTPQRVALCDRREERGYSRKNLIGHKN